MKKLLHRGWSVIGLGCLLGMAWCDVWNLSAGQPPCVVQVCRHPEWFWGPPAVFAAWTCWAIAHCWGRDEPRGH